MARTAWHPCGSGWRGNADQGRLQLVHLPVQAPWLNRVELFFRDLQRDVLNNSTFGGMRELVRAVMRYARWWNAHRAPDLRPETALVNVAA